MYSILLVFINWLNSDILYFSDSITIPHKSLFLWDLSLFSASKEWMQFKQ